MSRVYCEACKCTYQQGSGCLCDSMSGRISSERLQGLIDWALEFSESEPDNEDNLNALLAFRELEQSRALVAELRAMADEARSEGNAYADYLSVRLDSLLASHTMAKP